MARAESIRPRGAADPDITPDDREKIQSLLIEIGVNEPVARQILTRIGLPAHLIPAWTTGTPAQWWAQVFALFDAGAHEEPYRRLLRLLRAQYPHNHTVARLAERYLAGDDVHLTRQDREDLLQAVATVFSTELSAQRLLRPLGYPHGMQPPWTGTLDPEAWWAQVFDQFDHGIVAEPYRRLIASAVRTYTANPTFARLAHTYLSHEPSTSVARTPSEESLVVVRASDDDQRAEAVRVLRELGLNPVERWSTGHLVLAMLSVQTPSGARYRLVDTPGAQSVRDIAAELIGEEYGSHVGLSSVFQRMVIERVHPAGTPERLNPDDTLHDAGIRDGDHLRIGLEASAGGGGAYYPASDQDLGVLGTGDRLAMAEGVERALASLGSQLAQVRGLLREEIGTRLARLETQAARLDEKVSAAVAASSRRVPTRTRLTRLAERLTGLPLTRETAMRVAAATYEARLQRLLDRLGPAPAAATTSDQRIPR